MKQVALIACCKKKMDTAVPVPAHQLYRGQLFQAQLAYARQVLKLSDERIYVLSAKYRLIGIQEKILPYEKTLANMGLGARVNWGCCVVDIMWGGGFSVVRDTLVIMAGQAYLEGLALSLHDKGYKWSVPHPAGWGYGQQVAWYLNEVRNA